MHLSIFMAFDIQSPAKELFAYKGRQFYCTLKNYDAKKAENQAGSKQSDKPPAAGQERRVHSSLLFSITSAPITPGTTRRRSG